jgi:hypothetical protein
MKITILLLNEVMIITKEEENNNENNINCNCYNKIMSTICLHVE